MKILQLTKDIFAIFGIIPHKFIFRRPFNESGYLMLFLHGLSIALHCLFIVRIANTFAEYANAAFMTTAVISACSVYVVCLWRRGEIFTHMQCHQKTINKSKKICLNFIL